MVDDDLQNTSLISILRGVGFFAIGKMSGNLLGFALNLLLTRGLGPALYGTYSLARTIAGTVGSISNLGADKAVLRFVSSDDGSRNSQLGLSYIVATAGGIVVGAVLFIISPTISSYTLDSQPLILALQIFSVFLVVKALVEVTGNAFRAIDRPGLNSLLKQVLERLSVLVCVAIAFFFSAPFLGVVAAVVIAVGIASLLGFFLLYRHTALTLSFSADDVNICSYLNYSIPLAFKDAGSVMYTRVDILIVGALLTASAVGYYRIAILLSSLLTVPLAAVSQIFPPVISRLYSNDERIAMAGIFKTATRWILTGTLPAATGLIIFRREILSLFGNGFTTTSTLLVIFTIGQVSNAFVGPSGFLLMMTDRQFIVTANQWIFGLANVGLNFMLITQFGLIGAAIATAGVLIGVNLTRLAEVYYLERMHPFSRSMGKPVIAALLAGIVMAILQTVLPTQTNLLIGGIAGACVYFGCLALLGIEKRDKKLINEWVN